MLREQGWQEKEPWDTSSSISIPEPLIPKDEKSQTMEEEAKSTNEETRESASATSRI